MNRTGFLLLCGTGLLMTGCPVFQVYDGTGTSVKGVPFYRKVGHLEQTTIWRRTWLEIRFVLSAPPPGGQAAAKEDQVVSIRVEAEEASGGTLVEAIANARRKIAEDLDQIVNAFLSTGINAIDPKDFMGESSIDHEGECAALLETLVSNQTKVVSEIDYAAEHYFNVTAPPFGTAEGTIELNDDGTLTKGTGDVVAPKPADLLPLAEIVSKAAGLAPAEQVETQRGVRSLTISVVPRGYLYTFTSLHDVESPRRREPLTFRTADNALRTDLGGTPAPPRKDSPKKATFTGSVTLPND